MRADHAMSLKDAVALAERLGWRVRFKRREGEVFIIPPADIGRPMTISIHGRKEAPRCLTVPLKRATANA